MSDCGCDTGEGVYCLSSHRVLQVLPASDGFELPELFALQTPADHPLQVDRVTLVQPEGTNMLTSNNDVIISILLEPTVENAMSGCLGNPLQYFPPLCVSISCNSCLNFSL